MVAWLGLLVGSAGGQTPSLVDPDFDPRRGANGDVLAVALQPDGKVIVAGQFSRFDGTNRNGVARLHPDGSLDLGFDPGTGADGDVYALAVQADGKVVLAGNFTAINGVTSRCLARLETNGTVDLAFAAAVGTSINNELRCVAVQPDGRILIGGRFTKIAGQDRGRIARLNSDGTLDTSFGTGAGADNHVRCLVLQSDGRILIGGMFTTYDGVPRGRLARLNPDGSLDTSFDPGSGADDQVRAIAVGPDGRIYIGGDFELVNGTNKSAIARLFPDGSLDLSFDQGDPQDDRVRAMAVQADGRVWIGGAFGEAGGAACRNLARLNPDGSADLSFQPMPAADNEVFALVLQPDGRLLVGGEFERLDGLNRPRVARLLCESRAVAFEWAAGSVTVSEADGTAVVPVQRRGWQAGTHSVEVATADDSARADEDYLARSATLTFLPFETVKPFEVPILNDVAVEPTERFRVWLRNPSEGAQLGAATNCWVFITDNDTGFSLTATNLLVREEAGAVGLVVQRGTDPVGTVTVDYAAIDGTARNGWDYLLPAGTVTFLPGETQRELAVPLLPDAELEGPETFTILLTNPSPGCVLGAPASLTVTIDDSDSQFFIGTVWPGAEPSEPIRCQVRRRGLMSLPATVRIRTTDGTATAHADYLPVDQVLSFAPGESAQTVEVPVLNDGLVESAETVSLSLSQPTGLAVLTPPTNVVASIADNDAGIEFVEADLWVSELDTSATLVVRRGDDGAHTARVRFTTVAGTAQPGQDFVALSELLELPPGSSNTITIPLVYDCALEPEETFSVVLSEPSPGVSLGTATNACVTILDTERGGSLDLSLAPVNVPPFVPMPVTTLGLLGDGRILLGNMYGLEALGADTGLDTNLLSGPPFFFGPVPVNDVLVQAGDWMIVGLIGCFPDAFWGGPLVRLGPDGEVGWPWSAPCLSCGAVQRLAPLPDGGFLALGVLSFCGGPTLALARFRADGSHDPTFAPPTNLWPTVIAVQNDLKVLLGWVDGPPTLLRLQTNGAVDLSFQPVLGYAGPTAGDAGVRSLLVQPDGKIVISGHFRFVNGVPRTRLARLNPDGSLDQTFDPRAGLNASAAALALQPDGKLIVAGRFTRVDDLPCNQLARLNPDGSLDRSFDVGTGPNGTVDQVRVQPDGQILVAGAFDQFNGLPRQTLVRLNRGAGPTRFAAIARRAGAVTELRLEGARCASYVVEASADLRAWHPVSTNTPVAGQIIWRETNTAPQRFYRARGLSP